MSKPAVFDIPAYHTLLLLTDAAINVLPSVGQRPALIRSALPIARARGIETPRVACIAPAETVNERVPTTGECAAIVSAARDDATMDAVVDGPFGVDGAVRADAAGTKRTESAVAAIVAGARIPIVLTSRADREETKFLSIRLAIAVAHQLPNSSARERLGKP